MPSPLAPDIQGLIMAAITGPIDPATTPQHVLMISTNVANAWQSWMLSLQWSGLAVVGAGIGAWAGTGSAGVIIEPLPLAVPYTPFLKATPYEKAFQEGLAAGLKNAFTAWASAYKFTAVPFVGGSGATPANPGPFVANSVPLPLVGAGAGLNPQDSLIVADWKPVFLASGATVTEPTQALMEAYAKGICQAFQTKFLTQAQPTAGMAVGVAVAGAGTGITSSLPGVIV